MNQFEEIGLKMEKSSCLNDNIIKDFQEIEEESFEKELLYSEEELIERWNKKNRLSMFLTKNNKKIAMLLGYETANGIFYLDVLAVKEKGSGIGSRLMNYLIDWARINGYKKIKLDTEEINSKCDIKLLEFYKKFGFNEVERSNNGNITLECNL